MSDESRAKESQYEDSPTAWFVVLEAARRRGDFMRAALAQKALERLGVRVRYAAVERREVAHA